MIITSNRALVSKCYPKPSTWQVAYSWNGLITLSQLHANFNVSFTLPALTKTTLQSTLQSTCSGTFPEKYFGLHVIAVCKYCRDAGKL